MTDKELLELAAKAAGYEVAFADEYGEPTEVNGYWPQGYDDGGEVINWWNPLTDDGDALRLAVKLRFDISWFAGFGEVRVETYHADFSASAEVSDNDDPYAATRRAIVRVAASMGENMK